MTYIKAPYNFVPLSKETVLPSWEPLVNYDIPFTDHHSGTISVKVKAESAIYVKNGGKETTAFFNVDDQYQLPGSSLKGMLRSVMEIMTFSKMQQVNNDTYSIREFTNKEAYPALELAKNVRAAWFRKEGDTYYFQDCGKPGRIPHHWIDSGYNSNFREFYKQGGSFKGNNEDHKSAKFKYEKFKDSDRRNGFKQKDYGKENSVDVREFYEVDPHSKKTGTLVFTGQPGPRKDVPKGGTGKPSGKLHEFIFFDSNSKEFAIDERVIKNFFFAYFDNDLNNQSVDYKYWKKQLDSGDKIPVFFRYADEDKKMVKDFGLSYLYKIVYENSVLDLVPEKHKREGRDLTETIFGYTSKTAALKGRVHIGNAHTVGKVKVLNPVKAILGGPKASYYPNYIRQSGANGTVKKYATFMDATAEIAGWKRYPVHSKPASSAFGDLENSKVATTFTPLDKGAEFEFKIRVHNLRTIELGALLSAITFHNTNGKYHSIGMAKALGYGKIKLELAAMEGFEPVDFYLNAFEAYMNVALGHSAPYWHTSPQLTELFAMVSEQENKDGSELAYMTMDVKGTNEFVEAKKEKSYLQTYSSLTEKSANPNSLVSPQDIAACKSSEQELEKRFQVSNPELLKNSFQESELNKLKKELTVTIDALKISVSNLSGDIENKLTALNKTLKKAQAGDAPAVVQIIASDRDAFDKLKKLIEEFVKKSHGTNNYSSVLKDHPNGLFDGATADLIIEKTTEIYKSLKAKEQAGKLNVIAAKLSEWVGKTKADSWKKLNNH